jgi:prolyl-tRNA editing enzyme YbaK/EbsC (Cys-tRNA(Pro) deacylase)
VRAFFDPHLLTFPTVWAAAGTPRHLFGIDPARLLQISGATLAEFTA